MDVGELAAELGRLGIRAEVDTTTGLFVNSGPLRIFVEDGRWHVTYFERGSTDNLITPTADEDEACREFLRVLRALTGR